MYQSLWMVMPRHMVRAITSHNKPDSRAVALAHVAEFFDEYPTGTRSDYRAWARRNGRMVTAWQIARAAMKQP